MSQKKFITISNTIKGEFTYEELLIQMDRYIHKKVNDFINLKMKFKHNLFTTNGFEVINIEEYFKDWCKVIDKNELKKSINI